MSSSSGMAVSVSESSRSWSPGLPSRAGTCQKWGRGSVNDACEEPLSSRLKDLGALREPWLPSDCRKAIWISCFDLR